jgi:erythromycin esterase-like protein
MKFIQAFKNYMDAYEDTQSEALSREISRYCHPIKAAEDLDPLMEAIADARVVLLGEASHGTHEYYLWRSLISQRLIREKGFNYIAVEGDWPDCYKLNRYIKGYQPQYGSASKVLRKFDRWPTWMWANWEVAALADWLRSYNQGVPRRHMVGFYGLDVYSLWESMEAMVGYLDHEDRTAAREVRDLISCFEPYRGEDGQQYAWASKKVVPAPCQRDVLKLLRRIRERVPTYDHDQEAVLNTEQNAYVVHNAEKYYRSMISFGPDSWNVRDTHMADTLDRLMRFHGSDAKAIVWEHNTHIGDARATDMAADGLVNVGQLVRERYGRHKVFTLGFGAYRGSVIAADRWGAPMEAMSVPEARKNSWEAILHQAHEGNTLLLSRDLSGQTLMQKPHPHRAIGVVYDPELERRGNYVPSIIPERYDAFLQFEHTRPLHPMHMPGASDKTPETYPWGV